MAAGGTLLSSQGRPVVCMQRAASTPRREGGITMRLERLPIFIDLYETRSYTKTAQKNYVSQASVTQLVNSLEEEFGVKLFDRSTLPIQATAAGKQLSLSRNRDMHQA